MSEGIQNIQMPFLEEIKKNAGLTIAMGVILLLMGFFAMGSPLVAGLSVAMMVGVVLIIGGIGQLIFAFKTGNGILNILLGLLTVIIGGYMLSNPGAALASLTLFLAIYLIVSGILEAVMAFQVKPAKGWGWALFSGIISVLLGAMIWNQYPLSGAWAIGILLGVRLFFSGWTLIMLGVSVRSTAKVVASAA
jgi:uncharacterized membrane protein HdeD (DUF308 family)